jgi:hypothetical protein
MISENSEEQPVGSSTASARIWSLADSLQYYGWFFM